MSRICKQALVRIQNTMSMLNALEQALMRWLIGCMDVAIAQAYLHQTRSGPHHSHRWCPGMLLIHLLDEVMQESWDYQPKVWLSLRAYTSPIVRLYASFKQSVSPGYSLYNHTEKNYVVVYTTNVHFVKLWVVGQPISCMINKLRISSDRFIILVLESVEMTMFKDLRSMSATKRSAPCVSSISRTCSILIYAAPKHALP